MSSVALYLMTTKGLAVLYAAIKSEVEIAYVVTAPAAGMKDDADVRIAEVCKRSEIPVFLHAAPPEYVERADVTIAAGWRRLLDVDPIVVLHDSLLPRYRGFSPMITALVNGEPEIGVSAFLGRPEPDTGPIVAQRAIPISYPTRALDVIERLGPLYAELAAEICETIKSGEPLRAAEQDHARATHSLWRDDLDYRIDWSRDDRRICRLIDAVSHPFPGAWTTLAGEPRRIMDAYPVPDVRIEDRQPGKIFSIDGGMTATVVCGTGLVRITDIRDEQGRPQAFTRLKERFV